MEKPLRIPVILSLLCVFVTILSFFIALSKNIHIMVVLSMLGFTFASLNTLISVILMFEDE